MGRRGTKRRPNALKIADGTYREDRDGGAVMAPVGDVGEVPPPASLGAAGRRAWLSLVPQLASLAVLASIDLAAFETYCCLLDEIAQCNRALKKGKYYTNAKTGATVAHPAVNERLKLRALKRQYESDFALSPAARAGLRLDVQTASDDDDDIEVRKRV